MTSSRPTSALDTHLDVDELGCLSPVPMESFDASRSMEASYLDEMTQQNTMTSPPVAALRDGVGRRFSVELSSGCVYRASLPQHAVSPISEFRRFFFIIFCTLLQLAV